MDAETQFTDAASATTERAMHGAAVREPRRVSARRVKLLAHTLENDVIPRLVLSRSPTPAPAYIDRVASPGPTADDVSTMTGLVQQGDLEGALDYIGGLCASGMALPGAQGVGAALPGGQAAPAGHTSCTVEPAGQ
jgi:hypothetical protein